MVTLARKHCSMTDLIEQVIEEESFEDLLATMDGELKVPKENEIVTGTVIEITKDSVLIDIGFKSEGRINVNEFKDVRGDLIIKSGDVVDVLVVTREDDDGLCVLSKEKADKLKIWEQISAAAKRQESVRGSIIARVKGGLSVDIGVKAFLPGSQIELRPTRNLDQYIGQTYDFKVIRFDKKRGNIVLSRRALLEKEREELKARTLDKLQEEATVEGIVKNITDYGAFVDLGGIDGLLHITDMSWGRVNHPSQLFSIGDEIKVKVLKFNHERERVSLGYKQLFPDPWVNAPSRFPKHSRVKGRVVSLIEYGAFVELEEGIEGLIHVSEMHWTRRVKHPSRMVAVNDIIDVVVLNLDTKAKKISLGMKQIEPNPWSVLSTKYQAGTRIIGKIRNITDFGIFIGIEDGIDGLVHVSDLSWTQKIRKPSDQFRKGQEVEAVVLNIDVKSERFSLGIKQLTPDPWEIIPAKYPPGRIAEVKITKLTDFGAFAEIEQGVEGLIHISELSMDRIESPKDAVKIGEIVKAEVIGIDPRERKISLSVKSFKQRSERGSLREYYDESGTTSQLGDLLKDKLSTFVSE